MFQSGELCPWMQFPLLFFQNDIYSRKSNYRAVHLDGVAKVDFPKENQKESPFQKVYIYRMCAYRNTGYRVWRYRFFQNVILNYLNYVATFFTNNCQF